jgi:flagellar hook-length control protein FliK
LITDRLSSGPPAAGISDFMDAKRGGMKTEQKGPESFESHMKKDGEVQTTAKDPKPVRETPEKGQIEAGPRTKKDLSVENKRTDGDEEPDLKTKNEQELVVDLKGRKSQSQREKLMLEFMDSMESEFGIPPTRIVEAMANLSVKDLLKSPEETASQIVEKLELSPEQESRMEALYVGLLTKLSKLPDSQPEKMLVPTHERMAAMQMLASPQAFTAERQRRTMLNNSLNRLSQQFFMNGPESTQVADNVLAAQSLKTESTANPLLNDRSPQLMAYQDQKAAIDLSQIPRQTQTTPSSYKELAERMAQLGLSAEAVNEAVRNAPRDVQVQALRAEQVANGQINQSPEEGQNIPLAINMTNVAQKPNLQGEMARQDSGDSGRMSKGRTSENDFFLSQPKPEMNSAKADFSLPGVVTVASPAGGKVPAESNIQQIMNQAQYMIKKGGGEAVVKLNPEGMGEIRLKVAVNEGKVNLQMAANTKEAKSLIESSLSDLKTSLGAHNLKVDSIKVDVGNQLSSDNNNTNSQSGFRFDQGREQARQFLGNFHEENSANRGYFYEAPALRAYNPVKNPEPLGPAEEAQSRARRYIGEGRGNGLNLVV